MSASNIKDERRLEIHAYANAAQEGTVADQNVTAKETGQEVKIEDVRFEDMTVTTNGHLKEKHRLELRVSNSDQEETFKMFSTFQNEPTDNQSVAESESSAEAVNGPDEKITINEELQMVAYPTDYELLNITNTEKLIKKVIATKEDITEDETQLAETYSIQSEGDRPVNLDIQRKVQKAEQVDENGQLTKTKVVREDITISSQADNQKLASVKRITAKSILPEGEDGNRQVIIDTYEYMTANQEQDTLKHLEETYLVPSNHVHMAKIPGLA